MKEAKALAVAPQETKAVGPVGAPVWGSSELNSKDLMIPKILLMQGLSDAVQDKNLDVDTGDMINSVTLEKLGDEKNPVEIIPIHIFKTWVVSFKPIKGNKFNYVKTEPMTASNENAALEEEGVDEDGNKGTWRRDRTINVYALVAKELAEGGALPYVISFRRTSFTAGKKIATHFAKMGMIRQAPAAKSLMLKCTQEQNDLGTFYTYDVLPGRITTLEEVNTAFDWYKQISASAPKVDESDLKAVEPAPQTGPEQF